MPAKSKAQQKLMGMALAAKRGEGPAPRNAGGVMKMSKGQLEDFAGTKRKGLPGHVKKKGRGILAR